MFGRSVLIFSFFFASFAWDSLWYTELGLNTLESPLYLNDFTDVGGVKALALNTGFGDPIYDTTDLSLLHTRAFFDFNATWAVDFSTAYYNATIGQWFAFDGSGNLTGIAYQGLIGGCSLDRSFDAVRRIFAVLTPL
jgi:hypothetical protein